MMTDNEKEIVGYIKVNRRDNCDLWTLLHEIGEENFLKAVREANGRRIVLYHDPQDRLTCDPPIYWKYLK